MLPTIAEANAETLESVISDRKPLLVVIAKGSGTVFQNGDFTAIDKAAVVVAIKYKKGENAESAIPVSPLLSEFPADAYDVNGKKPCLLVCDWHGNAHLRLEGEVTPDAVLGAIKKLPKKIKDAEKKLAKNLDKANEYVVKEDIAKAIKTLRKNFKTGLVGLKSAEGSAQLYRDLIAQGREKLEGSNGDGTILEGLLKDYKGTELEDEINALLAKDVETQGASK
ncbi:hypothetical protein OAU50_02620 [Planctomycetota bacterium]|nr:hypothetical protein [Planctomycetota bacterium]